MNKLDENELYALVFKINEKFYEYIYQDEWLKNIFLVIDQKIITSQQTDFMVGALGGPKNYCGRNPKDAHPHIYIDEEMWQLREYYLNKSFDELNIPPELRKKWLIIDEAFKSSIIKKSLDDCAKRYNTDTIIYFPRKKSA